MNNYREKMREYLKEPNGYYRQYGKWGILNNNQRKMINRLLDEMDRTDVYIRKMFQEKVNLIKYLEDKIGTKKQYMQENNLDDGAFIFEKGIIYACEEILDKIKEGNYE